MSIIENDPHLYLDEIQMRVLCVTGQKWSLSFIWKKLKAQNYSIQVATERAAQRDEEERASYQMALYNHLHDLSQFIFIDETHKDRNATQCRRHWSKHGKSPYYNAFFCSHGCRYSLLAAADIDWFFVESFEVVERELGSNDSDETRGTVDTARFEQ